MKAGLRQLTRLARPLLLEQKQIKRAFSKINLMCRKEGLTPIPMEGFNSFSELVADASHIYLAALVHWHFQKMSRDKKAPLRWRDVEKKGLMFGKWLVAWRAISVQSRGELASLIKIIGRPPEFVDTFDRELASLVLACDKFLDIAVRAQGKPGENMTVPGGPPITPLYDLNSALKDWWGEHVEGRKWHPEFHSVEGAEVIPINTEAMIFVVVSQLLDTRYAPSNCLAVIQTRAGRTRKAKSKRPTIRQRLKIQIENC